MPWVPYPRYHRRGRDRHQSRARAANSRPPTARFRIRYSFRRPGRRLSRPPRAQHHRSSLRIDRTHTQVVLRFTLRAFEQTTAATEFQQFKKPITLTATYNPGGLFRRTRGRADLCLLASPRTSNGRLLPTTIDTVAHTLTAQTTHFTDFGIASAPDLQISLPNLMGDKGDLFLGAATMTYPIQVPAGRGGLTPKLNLAYSSASVDMMTVGQQASPVGVGWDLSTSRIVRDIRGNAIDSDDLFVLVLDGAGYDLMLGADGFYHTPQEQYWRIAFDTTNNLWTVITLDGTTYRFGSTANSRGTEWIWKEDGGVRPLTYAWWLDTVTDRQTSPNQITYTYLHDIGTAECGQAFPNVTYDDGLYPQTIGYNGGLSQINLTYAPRHDVRTALGGRVCGLPVQRQRLTQIAISTTVAGAQQLVRRYVLDNHHDQPTGTPTPPSTADTFPGVWQPGTSGRLTLWSITEYDASGYALPATTFTYPANRLGQVSNGLGGTVTYNYETVPFATSPTSTGVRGWSFPGDGYSTAGVSSAVVGTWGSGMALWVTTSGEQAVQFYLGNFIPGATYCFSAYAEGSIRLAAHFTVDGIDSEPTIMGWSGSGTGTRTGCATVPHRSDKAWFLIYGERHGHDRQRRRGSDSHLPPAGEPDRFRWPGHDQHVHVHLRQRGDERFGPLGRRCHGVAPSSGRYPVPRPRDGHSDRSDRGAHGIELLAGRCLPGAADRDRGVQREQRPDVG